MLLRKTAWSWKSGLAVISFVLMLSVFLNMAMLLAESENAKVLRQIMLDMQI